MVAMRSLQSREHFGVELDYGTATTWLTAGDIDRALLEELPEGEAGNPEPARPAFGRRDRRTP
jgi:hypothetical protein